MYVISRSAQFSSRTADEFLSMKEDEFLTDFKITSNGQTFPCHRVILAANSAVLKAMLKSKMKESRNQQVQLDNISPEIIKIIIRYMYSGHGFTKEEHMKELIEATDFLEMLELREWCINAVNTLLKPGNVIMWFELADRMSLKKMKSLCQEIMRSNFADVSNTSYFLQLDFQHLDDYLCDVQGKDIEPDQVLDAVIRWVNEDTESRLDVIEDLLKKVSLHKCSVDKIEAIRNNNAALLKSKPEVLILLTDSLIAISKRLIHSKAQKVPMILVVGGKCSDGINNQCWSIDHASSSVTDFCTLLPENCQDGSSLCKTSRGFAVTGGTSSDTVAEYDIEEACWRNLLKLSTSRYGHASIFTRGVLFVIGGHVAGSVSRSMHFLQAYQGKWSRGASLPEVVVWPEVASVGNNIYLINVSNNKLHQLNEEMTSWCTKSPLPGESCVGVRMVTTNNQLFVAGGCAQILAWYTPATDTWCLGAQPLLQHHLGAVIVNSKTLFLVGGREEESIEKYDMECNSWSLCEYKMPKKLYGLHGFILHKLP